MSLSKELVESFQALYATKNGKVIGFSEAAIQLRNLADLVRITATESKRSHNA